MAKKTNDTEPSPLSDVIIRLGFQICLDSNPEKNIIVSPLGIFHMLAMLFFGARGITRGQLAQMMGENDDDPLPEHISTLVHEVHNRSQLTTYEASVVKGSQARREKWLAQGMDPQVVESKVAGDLGSIGLDSKGTPRFSLSVANKAWIQQSYKPKSEFLQQMRDMLDVRVDSLDFDGQPDEACHVINAWFRDNTQGVIDSIITPAALSTLTRIVLANAVYLKAFWRSSFGPTRPGPFRLINGKTIEVQMMERTGTMHYMANRDFRAVFLSYEQRPVSMCLILPKSTGLQPLVDLERFFAQGDHADLFSAADSSYTHLAMPEYEFSFQADLAPVLSRLGLQNVFSGGDFSGISDEQGFGVGRMLHQASIHVDRFGTVAGAGTVALMVGSLPPKKVLEFMVDRPFLFLILDEPTGAPLFVGRVMDPG